MLTQEQLSIASDAMQADIETDPNVSLSIVPLTDIQAFYTHIQDAGATKGEWQDFISEAKTYADTDSWAKYDLDVRIQSIGAKATSIPYGTTPKTESTDWQSTLEDLVSAEAGPSSIESTQSAINQVESAATSVGDTVTNAAKSGYRAVKNAIAKVTLKPVTDWFSSLFGWVKWIVIIAAVLIAAFIVYKVAVLFK